MMSPFWGGGGLARGLYRQPPTHGFSFGAVNVEVECPSDVWTPVDQQYTLSTPVFLVVNLWSTCPPAKRRGGRVSQLE